MAKKTLRIRARKKGEITTVKALITHPMETGQRKHSKTGKLIPAHYIEQVIATSQGDEGCQTLMSAHWGPGVSKNPYVAFKYKGGMPGDEITIRWTDNQGQSGTGTAKLK